MESSIKNSDMNSAYAAQRRYLGEVGLLSTGVGGGVFKNMMRGSKQAVMVHLCR